VGSSPIISTFSVAFPAQSACGSPHEGGSRAFKGWLHCFNDSNRTRRPPPRGHPPRRRPDRRGAPVTGATAAAGDDRMTAQPASKVPLLGLFQDETWQGDYDDVSVHGNGTLHEPYGKIPVHLGGRGRCQRARTSNALSSGVNRDAPLSWLKSVAGVALAVHSVARSALRAHAPRHSGLVTSHSAR
jgi:hypothetical protein